VSSTDQIKRVTGLAGREVTPYPGFRADKMHTEAMAGFTLDIAAAPLLALFLTGREEIADQRVYVLR